MGRPNKIEQCGLGQEVMDLYSTDRTHKEIADELNKKYNTNISKDAVWRYVNKVGKIHENTEVVDELRNLFNDIEFKINMLNSLSPNDKRAILTYMRERRKSYEKYLSRGGVGSEYTSIEDLRRSLNYINYIV